VKKGYMSSKIKDHYLFPLLLTVLAIPVVEWFKAPNPMLVFMLLVVYFSFAGGKKSGLISAFLSIAYSIYFFSGSGSILQFTPDNLKKVLLVATSFPAAVWMVGSLKDGLEKKTIQLAKQMKDLDEQMHLAGKVQQFTQKGDYEDEAVLVKSIFQPVQVVSGDSYDYRWNNERSVFSGFVLDVAGHGVATALQTTGIRVVMEQEIGAIEKCSPDILERLNSRIEPYLLETSFAAAIIFSFDFRESELTVISGGINHFLCQQSGRMNWRTLPGSYIGISPKVEFNIAKISFFKGDSFFFVTDGIIDQIDIRVPPASQNYSDATLLLENLSKQSARKDDCTALCIKIK